MWDYAERAANDLFRMTGQLDREHWIFVGVGVLVVGVFLLKGFGTRI